MDAGTIEGALVMRDMASQVIAKVEGALKNFAKTTGGVGDEVSRVADSWGDRLTKGLDKAGESAKAAGKSLSIGLTLPLGGAALGALKLGSDFEDAMVQVETLAGVAKDEVAAMSASILGMADDVGKGPGELSKALLVVTSSGLKGAEALSVVEMAAKASSIGMGETKDVARALTSVLTAYGDTGLTAADAMNKLFIAVRVGAAEAAELAPTLGRVVGTAAQMGVKFEEVGAFIATFTRLGVDAAEATTSLGAVLSSMLDPTSEAASALASIGMSADDLRAAIREKGLQQALMDLQTQFAGNTTQMAALFGNVRALRGILGNTGAQAKAYAEAVKAMQTEHGAFDEAVARTRETNSFTWAQIKAQIETTSTVFGGALLPVVGRALGAFSGLLPVVQGAAHAFAAMPGPVQTTAASVIALAVAAGPLSYAFGAALTSASKLVGWFQTLQKSTAGTAAGYYALVAAENASSAARAVATFSTTAQATALQRLGLSQVAATGATTAGTVATYASGVASRATAALTTAWSAAITYLNGTSAVMAVRLWAQTAATAAAGAAAKAASVGVVAFGAAILALKLAAVAGLVYALVRSFQILGQAVSDAKRKMAEGKSFGEILSEKDENNWLRRALGMGNAAGQLAEDTKQAFQQIDAEVSGRNLAVKLGAIEQSYQKLKAQGGGLPEETRRLVAEIQALAAAGERVPPHLQAMVDQFSRAQGGGKALTQQLAEVERQLASLPPSVEENIKAGLKLGHNASDIAARLNQMNPSLKITAEAIDIYKDRLADATAKTNPAVKAVNELKEKVDELSGTKAAAEVGVLVSAFEKIGDVGKVSGPALEDARSKLESYFDVMRSRGETARADAVRLAADIDAALTRLAEGAPLKAAEDALRKVTRLGFDRASLDSLREAEGALQGYVESLRDGVRPADGMAEALERVRDAVARLEMKKAFDAPIDAMKKAGAELRAVGDLTRASREQLEGWASALEAGMDAALRQGRAVTDAEYAALKALKERLSALDEAARKEAANAAMKGVSIELARRLADAEREVKDVLKQVADAANLRALPESLREAGRMALEFRDRLAAVKTGTEQAKEMLLSLPEALRTEEMSRRIFAMVPAFEQSSQQMRDALFKQFEQMLADAGVTAAQIEAVFKGLKIEIKPPKPPKVDPKGFFDPATFGKGLGDTIMGALTGGGDVGKSVGGFLGGGIAQNLTSSLVKKLGTEGIGKALGGVLGSVVPGLGNILGSLAGGFVGKLFGGLFGDGEKKKTNEARDAFLAQAGGLEKVREMAEYAGVSIDRMLSTTKTKTFEAEVKKLEAAFRATQERVQQLGTDLASVMERGGIIGQDLWARLLSDKGKEDVQKMLGEVFSTSVDRAAAGFNRIATNVLALTTLPTDQIALITQEIERAAEASEKAKFAPEFLDAIPNMLAKIEPLAGAAFGALIAKGMSAVEAIQALAPGLDQIATILAATGQNATGAIGQLLGFRGVIDQHKELFEVLGGVDDMLVGLQNSGLLTQESFSSLASLVSGAFSQLTMQGVSAGDAITLMQPQLQKLWEIQQQFGLEVDETTQSLLDQAAANGQVGEQFMSATDRMAAGIDKMVAGFEALLTSLGVKVPAAMEGTERRGLAAMLGVKKAAESAAGAVETIGTKAEGTRRGFATAEEAARAMEKELAIAAKAAERGFGTVEDSVIAMQRRMAEAARETGDAIRKAVPTELRTSVKFDVEFPEMPTPTFPAGALPQMAAGGVVRRPLTAVIGEAGPEAVVPLDRLESWLERSWQASTLASRGTVAQPQEEVGYAPIQLNIDGVTWAKAFIRIVKRYGLWRP